MRSNISTDINLIGLYTGRSHQQPQPNRAYSCCLTLYTIQSHMSASPWVLVVYFSRATNFSLARFRCHHKWKASTYLFETMMGTIYMRWTNHSQEVIFAFLLADATWLCVMGSRNRVVHHQHGEEKLSTDPKFSIATTNGPRRAQRSHRGVPQKSTADENGEREPETHPKPDRTIRNPNCHPAWNVAQGDRKWPREKFVAAARKSVARAEIIGDGV